MSTPVQVLVCDDTAAKRYVIASWLRRDGYHVLEAETGAEAVAIAAQGIDLAVLDVHLPDMSGLDVCAEIKRDLRTAAVPVVHISAVAVDAADRSAGLENGADAYLVDPIEPREMLSMVRSLLRSSRLRREAERLAVRLDRVTAASLRINVALTPSRLSVAAAEGLARVLEAEGVALLVDGREKPVVSRVSAEGLTTTWELEPGSAYALLEAGAEPAVVYATDRPWSTLLPGSYDGPWFVMPIAQPEAAVGLLAVPGHAVRHEDDRGLVERLGESVGVALANLRVYAEEHRTALTLQRSLLPATLPSLPGLTLAARYKASGDQAEIGGDFFDAFQTDDGRSLVVIGDVQGHSLEAAVVMAEVRYSLRAYAHEGYAPEQVITRLDALLSRAHPDLTTSLCLLVLPAHGEVISVANAGHIPPLIVEDDTARFLGYGGTLLGVGLRPEPPIEVELAPGARIVLMTDGLVERRGQDISDAMDRFARDVEAASPQLEPEQLCDHLMARWGDAGGDDVCLIVVDVTPDPSRPRGAQVEVLAARSL